MKFVESGLGGLYYIDPTPFKDERGLFARTYCKKLFSEIHFDKEFVQFNYSFNKQKGTLRGLHFQFAPYGETKLIRCISGSVYDVAVDLRKGSPSFLQSFGIELSEQNMRSILIPEGFAHGFQTLEDNSALIYHHTEFYNPNYEDGLVYNDPSLKIDWPLPPVNISKKDKDYNLISKNFEAYEVQILQK